MSNSDTRYRAVVGLLAAVVATSSGLPVLANTPGDGSAGAAVDYRVLATSQTSTMERELNQAAEEGFRLEAVMGGDTAFGGSEVVAVVERRGSRARYAYRLLATSKTSTMQDELQAAAAEGYHYRFQTVFDTAFGGDEVVVILERDKDATIGSSEFLLLATSRTSTLQKELQTAAAKGYDLVGLTVGETGFSGSEVVAILSRSLSSDDPRAGQE